LLILNWIKAFDYLIVLIVTDWPRFAAVVTVAIFIALRSVRTPDEENLHARQQKDTRVASRESCGMPPGKNVTARGIQRK
jgi:hypothetical protein